jgi:adenylate kinase family enzyme
MTTETTQAAPIAVIQNPIPVGINLAAIKPSKAIKPPRIVLYGTPKSGKSTFASMIPDNLFLDIEGGSGALNASRINANELRSYDQFMTVLRSVYEQEHNFKSLTIDTLDTLEQLVFAQAAKEHSKASIADVGYGAGYVTAQNIWKDILQKFDYLRERKNMMIVLIAHDVVRRHDDPLTESYDRYSLSLHDKTSSLIKNWADVIGFVNNEVFVKKEEVGFKNTVKRATAGEKILHTVESPAFLAGNRYGLPAEIPFTWESFSSELFKAMM